MAMTLRLSESSDQAIDQIAAESNISKQQLLQKAVDEYIARHVKKEVFSEVFDRLVKRDAELLKRLEDA